MKVKVDVQCPYCGECYIEKVPDFMTRIVCSGCKQLVLLRWATGTCGELDQQGCYFVANTPFKLKEQNEEFEEIWNDVL